METKNQVDQNHQAHTTIVDISYKDTNKIMHHKCHLTLNLHHKLNHHHTLLHQKKSKKHTKMDSKMDTQLHHHIHQEVTQLLLLEKNQSVNHTNVKMKLNQSQNINLIMVNN
jgi:hypothetical protein